MNKRFEKILTILETTSETHWKEHRRYKRLTKRYREEIIKDNLIDKCWEDKDFAKQLCIMYDIEL